MTRRVVAVFVLDVVCCQARSCQLLASRNEVRRLLDRALLRPRVLERLNADQQVDPVVLQERLVLRRARNKLALLAVGEEEKTDAQ